MMPLVINHRTFIQTASNGHLALRPPINPTHEALTKP
jgi:hypothetical protein